MAEHSVGSTRPTVGIGYIAIPEKITREDYLEYIYNTEKVYIWTDSGEFIQDVPISVDLLSHLIIPRDSNELGSQVLWLNIEEHNNPIIVGILSRQDQSNFFREGEFRFERSLEENHVVISGFAKTGNILVSSKSLSQAKVTIKCIGDDTSEVNIISSGKVNVQAAKGLSYRDQNGSSLQLSSTSLLYTDSFNNEFKIDKDGYWFKDVNFKGYFVKILDMLKNKFQVNTAMGPSGFAIGTPTGDPSITELVSLLDNLNSDE